MKNKKNINKDELHPKDQACFLSNFFFCWEILILVKKWKNKISKEDFKVPPRNLDAKKTGDRLEKFWKEEELRKKPSLTRALLKSILLEFLLTGLLFFPVDMASTLLQPIYLGKLLEYFTPNQTLITQNQAFTYSGIIVSSSFLRIISFQFFCLETYSIGAKVRVSCSSLIYRTILKMKKTTIQNVTVGHLVNLLSNDVDRFERAFTRGHYIWIGPVKLTIAGYYLYDIFGYEGLLGAVSLGFFLITQGWVSNKLRDYRLKASSATDYRIRIISDVITGIQTIKMYAWEKSFAQLINSTRKIELQKLSKWNQLMVGNFTFTSYLNKIPIYVSILIVVLLKRPLTAQLVFLSINIYDLVRQSLQYTVVGISELSDVKASIIRIQEFLLLQNPKSKKSKIFSTRCLRGDRIHLEDVTATWGTTSIALSHIHFRVAPGEVVAIIGATGSGKSALIQAILQEMEVIDGSVEVTGTISYAPQEPWIFPATIKENIVFKEDYNQSKYLEVLKMCALEHDISLFPYGDNTLVGERGIMLSGGQKARVSLARAIYRDADIYLLDDPLAALDDSVSHQIFIECFLGHLMHKSVVLVTNKLHFLRNMDRIYILENGQVRHCGNYKELENVLGKSVDTAGKNFNRTSLVLQKYETPDEIEEDGGNSQNNILKMYISSIGHWIFVATILVTFTLSQIFMSLSEAFLSFWVNLEEGNLNLTFFSNINCFYIFTALFLLIVVTHHLSSWIFTYASMKASAYLHNTLTSKTLESSMKFFDRHQSGRILNRFSRDMGVIDSVLLYSVYQILRQSLVTAGVCVVVVAFNYWIIIPTVILFALFYFYFLSFQPATIHFKKVAATRRSPIFTHATSTVQGLTTIKALGAENHVLSQFDNYQNSFNSADYLSRVLYFAYGYWTDIVCALYSTSIIFYLAVFRESSSIGNAGLSITQSLLITTSAQYMLKMYGEIDSQMTSVERVADYADLVPEIDNGTTNPENWPDRGKVSFNSVSMRYSCHQNWVLRQVELEINPGEKIGVVGRTGAGKSSLISTLFRLYDFEGTITIDGVNTKEVPLATLRSKIAVIPQDPVLFLGTLRRNLDPLEEFSDSELWTALENVELKGLIATLPNGLDSTVLEGGTNFSVGQRQMLCLVRALLKNAKVVVLDEATANIDLETDELIQKTIRNRFEKATVLTIAHRLDTVMDCDRVVVMKNGAVVEFGTTEELLANSEGHFYKFVHHEY